MVLAAAAAGLLGLAGVAGAATTYSYIAQVQGGSFTPNATNTLNVYLQEVAPSGSFQAASDGGLFGGAVAVVENAGSSGITFTGATTNTSSGPPSGYQGGLSQSGLATNTSGPNAGAWIADALQFGPSTGVAPASTSTNGLGVTTSLYLLGTVTLQLGATPTGSLTIESLFNAPAGQGFHNAGTDGNTFTFSNGYDLDGNHNGDALPPGDTIANTADSNPTTMAVTAAAPVPEPASLAVFGLGGAALLARRRRRTA